MAQLIGIFDELSRFLTLPTSSRSRHKFTTAGRLEAARTMEVSYYLLESMSTQRITRLVYYSERLKKMGCSTSEMSRIRQWERFLSDNVEQLRMVKMYRTPLALRSFARIFTVFLPAFYAPSYARVAVLVNSLGMGIAFGVITALSLTALFESLQVLEDPFTAYLALDGIDVREELEVLHFAQLINTRNLVFRDAPPYPLRRRCALTNEPLPRKKRHFIGLPPTHPPHISTEPSASKSDERNVDPNSEGVPKQSFDMYDEHVDVELGNFIAEAEDERAREPFFAGITSSEELSRAPNGSMHSHESGWFSTRRLSVMRNG